MLLDIYLCMLMEHQRIKALRGLGMAVILQICFKLQLCNVSSFYITEIYCNKILNICLYYTVKSHFKSFT